ncbi:hypothetical protein FOMPIDRAFT_1055940 [Fomitopsis schrenkii]|uniref:Fungal-type protein kinase domain-containing protein n=1 Tax=Fomitopsis schrenkii TaxID=2126942 RepID=S8DIP2_FOMSC|nr:hypothetical protein FOMPIDRAFT_1055940 [Fomitopsis schrenkii]
MPQRRIVPIVCKPLWEYPDELQLLNGLVSNVKAHECLCCKGFLHGDISPNTMLFWPDGSAVAFLMSPKAARLDRIDKQLQTAPTPGRDLRTMAVNLVQKGIDRSNGESIITPGGSGEDRLEIF